MIVVMNMFRYLWDWIRLDGGYTKMSGAGVASSCHSVMKLGKLTKRK